jgi:two-component system alkaline phosphatase synthesis response regulator PhoP
MVPEKILVVDDEPQALKLMKIDLEGEGYRVWTAATGKEAVHRAHQVLPDLILMDIMLPDMTGGEVVKALKSDPSTRSLRIVFFTALFSKKEEKEHQMLNVDDEQYLTIAKPFAAEELLKQIRKVLPKESSEKR